MWNMRLLEQVRREPKYADQIETYKSYWGIGQCDQIDKT